MSYTFRWINASLLLLLLLVVFTPVLPSPLPPPLPDSSHIIYHASAPHHPFTSTVHLPTFTPSQSNAFFLALLMILFSEIGDKTFFIAAILAVRTPSRVVFAGAAAALVVMSILSAVLGSLVAPNVASRRWVTLAAGVLFFFYGVKNAHDAYNMPNDAQDEELQEVEQEILNEYKYEEGNKPFDTIMSPAWGTRKVTWRHMLQSWYKGCTNLMALVFTPGCVQAFVMVFLAEWGDRSQIATIALAASEDTYFVTLGTVVGHLICTGLAVVGGRLLAKRISMRHVTLAGAVLFVLFSFIYFYQGITSD